MGKINEQTLKEATVSLHQAVAALAIFDCHGLDCDSCPLQYEKRCAAVILSEMHTRAISEKLKEDYYDNH